MDVKIEKPLLPLRDIVVFPNMVIPLFVGRDKSIATLNDSMKKDKKVILATKIVGPGPCLIRDGGGNYNEINISKAIEGSLKRLQTDYIDLYQLHWPERNTNFFGTRDYKHKVNDGVELDFDGIDASKTDEHGGWNGFESILEVLKTSKRKKIFSIGFLGNGGGRAKKITDLNLIVKSTNVARIQETHILLGHFIFNEVEKKILKEHRNTKGKTLK